jgi:hypothetical protein
VSELTFEDKGNDDYNLVIGPVKMEFSRGINMETTEPVWRFWSLTVDKDVVAGGGSGKVLKPTRFTRFLEAQYELSS